MIEYLPTQKGFFSRTFSALSHRNFRLFWTGQCISLVGMWMKIIGQYWLVLKITDSPFLLGLISALQFLPVLFFSLFAGTLVDRFKKRYLLIITQTIYSILALTLAILITTNLIQYWHIALVA
ncbi:MAG: MFS transporter, partial [Thermodesulfobacteriota bacterium]|nr:MFS transporter [Thermodesulfobacteriota bacterium]